MSNGIFQEEDEEVEVAVSNFCSDGAKIFLSHSKKGFSVLLEQDEEEVEEDDEEDDDEEEHEEEFYGEYEDHQEDSVNTIERSEDYVEPYFMPPQVQMFATIGAILLSQRVDLFNPTVVRVIR